MKNYKVQMRVIIAILIAGLDSVEAVRWLYIDCPDGIASEEAANKYAIVLAQIAVTKVWESICRALPNVTDLRLEITVDSVTHKASYNKVVIGPDTICTKWSPALSKIMELVEVQIRKELQSCLIDVAEARFSGNPVEKEALSHELRQRN